MTSSVSHMLTELSTPLEEVSMLVQRSAGILNIVTNDFCRLADGERGFRTPAKDVEEALNTCFDMLREADRQLDKAMGEDGRS